VSAEPRRTPTGSMAAEIAAALSAGRR